MSLLTANQAEDQECDEEGENHDNGLIPLPQEIDDLSNTLPMLTLRRPNVRSLEVLIAFLPDRAKALSLCNNYLNHAIFFFRPITHEELLELLLPHIYTTATARLHARASGQSPTDPSAIDDSALPHALASLFFVFSLGALLDINLPPYNPQAEHYYHLGRAALSLRKMWPPSLETIQAVGLMATYHSLAGKKYSRDSAVRTFASRSQKGSLISTIVVHHELGGEVGSECASVHFLSCGTANLKLNSSQFGLR